MNATSQPQAEDQAWRRAARAYFAQKTPVAEARFDPRFLRTFRTFAEHWQDYFAPEDPENLRQYLALPLEQRRAQFERFRRECHSWELSFKLSAPGRRPTPSGGNGTSSDNVRRRIEAHNLREADVHALYADLDSRHETSRLKPRYSAELLTHLRELGLTMSNPTPEEARRQYRRLAMLHHPDRAGNQEKMQRLNRAFQVVMGHFRKAAR